MVRGNHLVELAVLEGFFPLTFYFETALKGGHGQKTSEGPGDGVLTE